MANKGVFIKCENAIRDDFCLLQLSRLDIQGDLGAFLEKNLLVFTDSMGTLTKLKIAGFVDGEDSEEVEIVPFESGYWRPIHEVGFVFAQTELRAKLLVAVPS